MDDKTKVAIVTGATSGIGRASVLGFAAAGYAVAFCGRRAERIAELAQIAGPLALGRVCDISDPEAVAGFFEAVAAQYGRVDVVFNNAGRSAPAAETGDFDVALWQDMVATNLNGAFYVAREAFRQMRAQTPQGGRIINNGSISAYTPRPHAIAYNATKHAISGLTKSISLDGRPYSIACGQIDIGNAATDMTAAMQSGMLQADGSMKAEPRFDVSNVVEAVLYMAGLPLSANVQSMTILATNMPYVGRG